MARCCLTDNQITEQKQTSIDFRNCLEMIRNRAETTLSGKQLAIIKLYLDRGATCSEIAELAGKSESSIYRIINKTIKRLLQPQSTKLIRSPNKLSLIERKVVFSYYFDGLSLRKTASANGCSLRKVREIIDQRKDISDGNNH